MTRGGLYTLDAHRVLAHTVFFYHSRFFLSVIPAFFCHSDFFLSFRLFFLSFRRNSLCKNYSCFLQSGKIALEIV